MALDPRHRSRTLYDGKERAPARSQLKAIGFSDTDLTQPIVGIANTWIGTMPCNYNLRALAEKVKQGVRAAGGTPMEFNTIAISDAITMGTEGMKASLVSREVIATPIPRRYAAPPTRVVHPRTGVRWSVTRAVPSGPLRSGGRRCG